MANINQISPDGGTTVYDIEDPTARSGVNALTPRVGITEGKIATLEEQMLSVQDDLDDLGTASTKNSTSVVTQSTDLVESGAVYDALGFGNANKLPPVIWHLNNTSTFDGSSSDDNPIRTRTTPAFAFPFPSQTFEISGLPSCITALNGVKCFDSAKTEIGMAQVSGYKFTTLANTAYVYILLNGENITVADMANAQIMVCHEGKTPSSYEPYHSSVNDTLRDAEVIEGKNLLRNIAKSDSKQGIDYTVNNDKSVTCSNTASNSSVLLVGDIDTTELIVGETYILSGCPKNGADNKYYLRLGLKESASDAWGTNIGKDFGDGYEFTVPANSYGFTVNIGINAGQATNFTYYPMICTLEEWNKSHNYKPYYIPLKDVVPTKADNSVIGTVEGANASKAWSVGEHFIKDGQFKEVTQPIASGGAISDSNTVDKPIADCLLRLLPIFNNAGSHNGIFRGKNLGSSLTTAQKTAIANGSFEDLYIGDYWEINGIKWRIAHFDYWLNCGDGSNICTDHHVVVVPDSALVNKRMNAKVDNVDTTAGAYVNSEMRTTNLADAKTIVNAAFGADNILGHREYMQNAVTDGYESAGAWVNADIELMSEIMVYGSNIFHNIRNGTAQPNNITINKTQLALFGLDPSCIICKNVAQTERSHWWLRGVVSATSFAGVAYNGYAYYYGASDSLGVRPSFGIK